MSIQPEFDNPQLAAIGTTPIILRFEGLHPGDLGRFCMHNDRLGGDLSHVDPDATGRNAVLFGADDWKKTLCTAVDSMLCHACRFAKGAASIACPIQKFPYFQI